MEAHGYFFDKNLLTASAGYVRDAFVMASIGQHAEYKHLERILMDAACTEPISIDDKDFIQAIDSEKNKNTKREPTNPCRTHQEITPGNLH